MIQEYKDLLLKDLCARLLYGLMVDRLGVPRKVLSINPYDNASLLLDRGEYTPAWYRIDDVKPYLRPMSSMTEEEEIEYDATFATIKTDGHYDSTMTHKSFDFLNAHHFDYRGLIEKGLAIEAPEGMY